MKCLFIIPARGGSKGIPGKNLINLAGKPLIQWSIEAAKNTAVAKKDIWVSSDCNDILTFAESQDVHTLRRPPELATDSSPTEPVLVHLLQEQALTEREFDYLVLLQPTSPLRNEKHIDQALKHIDEKQADALISVTKPDKHPLKAFTVNDDGFMQGVRDNEAPFMPRQSLPLACYPNGAIFVVNMCAFMKNHALFQPHTLPFYMPSQESVDIDSPEDLVTTEKRLQEQL